MHLCWLLSRIGAVLKSWFSSRSAPPSFTFHISSHNGSHELGLQFFFPCLNTESSSYAEWFPPSYTFAFTCPTFIWLQHAIPSIFQWCTPITNHRSTRSHKILSWSLSIVQTCMHLSRFVSLCHYPYSFNWLVYHRSVWLMALCQSLTSQWWCIYSVLCMLTLQRGIGSSRTRVPWTSKGSSMI